MAGRLKTDPLFVGLTRSAMVFGVSIQFAILNLSLSIAFFIQMKHILILVIALIVHFCGYLLCFKEPKFIEIYLMKLGQFNKCQNKIYYGANSYLP